MNKVLFVRHLEDVNDLVQYGRDAPVASCQENDYDLLAMTGSIISKMKNNDRRSALFLTSSKLRTRQTAILAKLAMQNIDNSIRVYHSVAESLDPNSQGTFVIPTEYEAGEQFEGLYLAGKIFNEEAHGSDNPGGFDNILYRFGDPVLLPGGSYKYPEIKSYFTDFGESYRDAMVRIYSSVVDMHNKYHELGRSTELVVFAHGFTYHILRGLSIIANEVKYRNQNIAPGDTIKLSWEIYKQCDDTEKTPGICRELDISLLGDSDLITILRKEIDYLQSIERSDIEER